MSSVLEEGRETVPFPLLWDDFIHQNSTEQLHQNVNNILVHFTSLWSSVHFLELNI